MTDQNTITRDRNQKVVKDFLALLAAKNIEAWIELWADDGVQEMPYSPPGFPSRNEGKTAIHLHYSGLPDAYSRMAFPDLKIYPMLDPNWLLAEYRGEIDITRRVTLTTTITAPCSTYAIVGSCCSRNISTQLF